MKARRGLPGRAALACLLAALLTALAPAPPPTPPTAARTGLQIGTDLLREGNLDAAEAAFRQALEPARAADPESLETAALVSRLGVVALRRGDLRQAEEHFRAAESIQARREPAGQAHAGTLANLGSVSRQRGDLGQAESFDRQAMEIFAALDPEGPDVATLRGNLANIQAERGDLAGAEATLESAVAQLVRREPDGVNLANLYNSLAAVAQRRSDLAAAERHLELALALHERRGTHGAALAVPLRNLAVVAQLNGDLPRARQLFGRALELCRKEDPASLDTAKSLGYLGQLETEPGGDPARGEPLLRQALAIYEEKAPQSLFVADTLLAAGRLAGRRGEPDQAVDLLGRAVDLRRRLVPDSTAMAVALHYLGLAEGKAGGPEAGLAHLIEAVDRLDRQRPRRGGSAAGTGFESAYADAYGSAVAALVHAGRPGQAFAVLERGRARAFLALLAERDLRFAELPAGLAAERRALDAEYDRLQGRLGALAAGPEADAARARLGEIHDRQEGIVARIRRESPRFAALAYPAPFDLDRARRALDPGTVLLAFAVGADESFLFAVQPAGRRGPGVAVFPLSLGEAELRRDAEAWRRLLADPAAEPGPLAERAAALYARLLGPAEAAITPARRLLISPDGPLHTVPFAALMRRGRYLAASKPVHLALSATVYAEPQRPRSGPPPPLQLAAFGDPLYPRQAGGSPADPALGEATLRGLSLAPLPASRHEVERIAALFPRGKIYLGAAATEEAAKQIGGLARFLHFATHGYYDSRLPLNSALALSPPGAVAEGRDNGLLQAWEILEKLRLDADLVTLSACDTALGAEAAGEGLIGLTRAFQYAGARSVVASLWGVADTSTSRLMASFYLHLRQGMSKDEALRHAQLELIRGRDRKAAHPFHWAAFQLYGAWR